MFEDIRKKIVDNRLKQAFEELAQRKELFDTETWDMLIILQARFRSASQKNALKLMTEDNFAVEKNSVTMALLNILTELEEKLSAQPPASGESISADNLATLKKLLKEMVDELRFDEIFEKIEEKASVLTFERATLSTLRNEYVHEGRTDLVFCGRVRAFVSTIQIKN
jgi:hypothetical protein